MNREIAMTIDKSLRVKRGATRNRSVLTRVERITRLREADRWKEGDSPLGLPKVRVRKLTMKKKKKKKEDEEGAAAEGGAAAATAPAAGAAAAKPAAGGAKPAAGAAKPAAGGKAGGKGGK
jgi:small basic protein (TIGR04137 family)